MRLLLQEGIGYSKLSHFLADVYLDLNVCFSNLISFGVTHPFEAFHEFASFFNEITKLLYCPLT